MRPAMNPFTWFKATQDWVQGTETLTLWMPLTLIGDLSCPNCFGIMVVTFQQYFEGEANGFSMA